MTKRPTEKRTGVIQPLPGIGDMIWYLPALKALAANTADGKITLFARPSAQAPLVLSAEPMIRNVAPLPPNQRGLLAALPNFFHTWRALAKARPDRLYILHQSPRYRLAAKLAGIREIIAYPPDLGRSKDDGWTKSLSFLKQQGIPVPNPLAQLTVAPAALTAIRERFKNCPQPWFVIAPGASTATRLWPTERFAFCADALAESLKGTIFLIGAPNEAERIKTLLTLCRNTDKLVPVTELPFDQVMGLIACSIGLFGNDSGPANVAAALGRPAFPLCGISTPPRHSPNLHFILPDLAPETGNGMERISAQHALESIQKIIAPADGEPKTRA